jgi:hypothetical protein
MQVGRIEGATRVLGKAQGYVPLPVRDTAVLFRGGDTQPTPVMMTAWFPTMEELQALVGGAPVYLYVVGYQHPPVKLEVGEAPDDLVKASAPKERGTDYTKNGGMSG